MVFPLFCLILSFIFWPLDVPFRAVYLGYFSVLSWVLSSYLDLLFQLIVTKPHNLLVILEEILSHFKRMESCFSYEPLFMPIRLVQHYLWRRCFSWLKDQNVHFGIDYPQVQITVPWAQRWEWGENQLKLLHSYEPGKWQLDLYLQVYVKFVQNVNICPDLLCLSSCILPNFASAIKPMFYHK